MQVLYETQLWVDRILFWEGSLLLRAWAVADCAVRKAAAFPAANKLTKAGMAGHPDRGRRTRFVVLLPAESAVSRFGGRGGRVSRRCATCCSRGVRREPLVARCQSPTAQSRGGRASSDDSWASRGGCAAPTCRLTAGCSMAGSAPVGERRADPGWSGRTCWRGRRTCGCEPANSWSGSGPGSTRRWIPASAARG